MSAHASHGCRNLGNASVEHAIQYVTGLERTGRLSKPLLPLIGSPNARNWIQICGIVNSENDQDLTNSTEHLLECWPDDLRVLPPQFCFDFENSTSALACLTLIRKISHQTTWVRRGQVDHWKLVKEVQKIRQLDTNVDTVENWHSIFHHVRMASLTHLTLSDGPLLWRAQNDESYRLKAIECLKNPIWKNTIERLHIRADFGCMIGMSLSILVSDPWPMLEELTVPYTWLKQNASDLVTLGKLPRLRTLRLRLVASQAEISMDALIAVSHYCRDNEIDLDLKVDSKLSRKFVATISESVFATHIDLEIPNRSPGTRLNWQNLNSSELSLQLNGFHRELSLNAPRVEEAFSSFAESDKPESAAGMNIDHLTAATLFKRVSSERFSKLKTLRISYDSFNVGNSTDLGQFSTKPMLTGEMFPALESLDLYVDLNTITDLRRAKNFRLNPTIRALTVDLRPIAADEISRVDYFFRCLFAGIHPEQLESFAFRGPENFAQSIICHGSETLVNIRHLGDSACSLLTSAISKALVFENLEVLVSSHLYQNRSLIDPKHLPSLIDLRSQ